MNLNIKELLKQNKLKATPSRLEIISLFSTTSMPINAEQLMNMIKGKSPDLVTIYRTLNSFEEAGILKRVNLQKGSIYYELSDHHHHHIVCTDCGTIEDFEECKLSDVSKKILKKSSKFKKINDHAFELFGMCISCSNK